MGGRLLLGSTSVSLVLGLRPRPLLALQLQQAAMLDGRSHVVPTAARDPLDPSAEEDLVTPTDVRRTGTGSATREKFRSV